MPKSSGTTTRCTTSPETPTSRSASAAAMTLASPSTPPLYHRAFPLIVFTGANAPTTVEVFPRGEAVHYAERAEQLGVPDTAIVVEPQAGNTGENFRLTRALLEREGIHPESATIISRPYQQRRACATCQKLWPELDVICSSRPQSLSDYIESIGDEDKVLNMLVGDTQRIWVYADQGFAAPQDVPAQVMGAYSRLVAEGYTAASSSRALRERGRQALRQRRGVIFDASGENVLLIKRRNNGHWEPPGGVLELGETIEAGLRREVEEEAGVKIDIGPLTGVYQNVPGGIVALVFRCTTTDVPVESSAEAFTVAWRCRECRQTHDRYIYSASARRCAIPKRMAHISAATMASTCYSPGQAQAFWDV